MFIAACPNTIIVLQPQLSTVAMATIVRFGEIPVFLKAIREKYIIIAEEEHILTLGYVYIFIVEVRYNALFMPILL